MGKAAQDDPDLHENYTFRDLRAEVEGPLFAKVKELEWLLLRAKIGDKGNFNRSFVASGVNGDSEIAL